jgi:1A family penicillin-binding protein
MNRTSKKEVKKERFAKVKTKWRLLFQKLLIGIAGVLLIILCLPLAPPVQPVTTQILGDNGEVISLLYRENRQPVQLSEIPDFLQQAFLAVEDHRFYQHNGFSPVSFFRAAYHNLFVRKGLQGFSTITQQVAKNCYLSAEKTLIRKIKELFLAFRLELHYSKEQILEMYLNQIYFGHGAYGIKTAALTYFGKPLPELNRIEWALLAGIPKGPALYSPYLNREAALNRIKTVLHRMVTVSYITEEEKEEILNEQMRLPGLQNSPKQAHYFLDYALDEAEKILHLPKDQIPGLGLKIETSLSLPIQKAAETALKNGLSPYQHNLQPQGAIIAANPRTGEIKALVGGTDYYKTPFNRALKAYRQPGSAFKPFVYLAALEAGYTLASTIPCHALSFSTDSGIYEPRDYGTKPYHQRNLTLREALTVSCNIVAVSLHQRLDITPTINMARRLGITSPLKENLSLALGSSEVTPIELLQAYTPIANGGRSVPLWAVKRIYNDKGKLIWERKPHTRQVLDPRLAFLITSVLEGTLRPGGTAAVAGNNLRHRAAGKTGTTQDNRDAWFVGYTPQLAAIVYIGDDQNKPLPAGGGSLAAPIWVNFLNQALTDTPAQQFLMPEGIISRKICRETGLLATPECPGLNEYFLFGREPTVYCAKHRRIKLRICTKSKLLPGPYCRDVEEQDFAWEKHPTTTCEECQAPRNLWEYFFGKPFPLFKPKED